MFYVHDLYIDDVRGDQFEGLLYANSDLSVINIGIYHSGPAILYYAFVIGIMTLLKKPKPACGEMEGTG